MLKILFWPLSLAGFIIRSVLSFAGNVVSFFLGLGAIAVGVALCVTVIGAVVGVPLILLGIGIAFKSLF